MQELSATLWALAKAQHVGPAMPPLLHVSWVHGVYCQLYPPVSRGVSALPWLEQTWLSLAVLLYAVCAVGGFTD